MLIRTKNRSESPVKKMKGNPESWVVLYEDLIICSCLRKNTSKLKSQLVQFTNFILCFFFFINCMIQEKIKNTIKKQKQN